MRVFWQIAQFVIGLVQIIAVWDGVAYLIGANSFIGKAFAFLVALFLTYIPLVGSLIGVYGAVNVWDWSLVKSLILFFWYVPIIIPIIGYSLIANRGR